jgi:hypothetical protein
MAVLVAVGERLRLYSLPRTRIDALSPVKRLGSAVIEMVRGASKDTYWGLGQ